MLNMVSASQVESWRRCQRYWHFKHVQKISSPPTEAQQRGIDIHKAIENYLKTGSRSSSWDRFVETAIPFLPKREEAPFIEKKFTLDTWEGGPKWIGYIDLLEHARRPVRVLDYKTISDFRYCKTPQELAENTQLNSYALWAKESGAWIGEELEVGHLYLLTKTKTPKPNYVSARITPESVRGVWQRDLETVAEMCGVTAKSADELPPTTESCTMYGGCPYRTRCGLTPVPLIPRKEKKTMSEPAFLKKLKEKQNGEGQMPPPAPPAPVAQTAAAAPKAKANVTLSGDAAKKYAASLGFQIPDGSTVQVSEEDAAQFISPEISIAAQTPAVTITQGAEPIGVLSPDAAPRSGNISEDATPAEAPKKRRGRPKKNEAAESEAQGEGSAPTGPIATAQAEAPIENPTNGAEVSAPRLDTPKRAAKPRLGLELYIDCMPVKDPGAEYDYTLFEDWISPLAQAVADTHGVADYRLLQYGAGKVALANEIRCRIEGVPPILVINSMAVGAHDALDVLIPYAKKVVRALKG